MWEGVAGEREVKQREEQMNERVRRVVARRKSNAQ